MVCIFFSIKVYKIYIKMLVSIQFVYYDTGKDI